MRIDEPRALVLRLIVGELLARPGTGPLAPRHFVRAHGPAGDAAERVARERPREPKP